MTAFSGARRFPDKRVELWSRRGLVTPGEAAGLMALVDAGRRPSTITDAYGADPGFRTSETCDLDSADPLVALIRSRIADWAGLPLAHAEPLQGQRYAEGQEFRFHTDYFEPTGLDYWDHCARAGQRTWTVMIYLNQPDAGGATRFKHLGKLFQPETGMALAWNNRLPDGGVNAWTLHAGLPVRRGTKYVITAWFRDQPWPA